jgi:hypothetical protein
VTRLARRFRSVARSLRRVDLMRSSMDAAFALTDEDLLDKNAGRRFLDFYGDEGIMRALEAYGITRVLRQRGWEGFHLDVQARDERHTMILTAERPDGPGPERLFELVVRRDRLRMSPDPPREALEEAFEVLTVDWLSLRDPSRAFTETRRRLPGQDAPGSRLGEAVVEMLFQTLERLDLDGLLTVPEYFHNAVLYDREMPYVNPEDRGRLRALEELLFDAEGLDLCQAAWAVHWGHVLDAEDRSLVWKGQPMLHPRAESLSEYLESPEHAAQTAHHRALCRFRLHRSAFVEAWEREQDALLRPPAPDEGPV